MRLGALTRRHLARLTAATAAVLLMAGCVQNTPDQDGAPSDGGGEGTQQSEGTPALTDLGTSAAQDLPTDPASDPAYAAYYEQSIDWGPCEDVTDGQDLECGTVTVPLQWDDPEAGDIDLAVARKAATSEATGSLVLNPGGPGQSGVDMLASASYLFSPQIEAAYDLVGFDPRGVSRSAGIDCLSDEEIDQARAESVDMSSAEGKQEALESTREMGEACGSSDGDVLPYLDTYSAARDMDVLRAAVDSEQLDYLGFSYGTYLGATYADLYPERVGRFVLDGALDPTITLDEFVGGQAEGFEKATDAFLQDCLERSEQCPFKGEVPEAKQQLQSFFSTVGEEPLETGDAERPLTEPLARSAVMLLMYDDAYWQMGREAISAAMSGDGSQLLRLADSSAGRESDGTYSGNSRVASTAINCLDHPWVADEQWQDEQAQRLAEEYPTFGAGFGYSGAACGQWPQPPLREPAPISAEGSDPIVVIGTTGDPATPYEWSQSMAEQLDNSVLLTYEGDGHTAYGRSGGCIEEEVDAYLLEGTVPEDGLTC